MLRVLLTNDDGISALGLKQLAARLAPHCALTVLAPQKPQSATSHSITLHKPLRLQRVEGFARDIDPGAEIEAWHCSGTPSDCVSMGLHHLLRERPPHIVLSGINDGRNVAQDLTYSGTVGAALEAAVSSVPGIALSLDVKERHNYAETAELCDLLLGLLIYGEVFEWHTDTLARLNAGEGPATEMLEHLWSLPFRATTTLPAYPEPEQWFSLSGGRSACINVNIPDRSLAEIRGIAWTRGGNRRYKDVIAETFDPRGNPYYWIAGRRINEPQPAGTDIHALAEGYVSVSPLNYDITSIADLEGLAHRFVER